MRLAFQALLQKFGPAQQRVQSSGARLVVDRVSYQPPGQAALLPWVSGHCQNQVLEAAEFTHWPLFCDCFVADIVGMVFNLALLCCNL